MKDISHFDKRQNTGFVRAHTCLWAITHEPNEIRWWAYPWKRNYRIKSLATARSQLRCSRVMRQVCAWLIVHNPLQQVKDDFVVLDIGIITDSTVNCCNEREKEEKSVQYKGTSSARSKHEKRNSVKTFTSASKVSKDTSIVVITEQPVHLVFRGRLTIVKRVLYLCANSHASITLSRSISKQRN